MRRGVLLLVLAGLLVSATALAQDGGAGSPTPVLRSDSVLHLEHARTCRGNELVTLRVTPDGAELGWLSVRMGGQQIVRLTGVASDASVTLRIPQSGARIGVSAETLDGQRLATGRHYTSCAPRPVRPRPPAPTAPHHHPPPSTIIGGGEA